MKLKEHLAKVHLIFVTEDSLINEFRGEDIRESYLKGWNTAFQCISFLINEEEEKYDDEEKDLQQLLKKIKNLKEKEMG